MVNKLDDQFSSYPDLTHLYDKTKIDPFLPVPSAPVMDSNLIWNEKKVIDIKSYIHSRAARYEQVKADISHIKLESKLWYANMFIIPLIVYPLISLIGHIAIAYYNSISAHDKAYGKIKKYLDLNVNLMTSGKKTKITLDKNDILVIKKILNNVNAKARSKDPFNMKLASVLFYNMIQDEKKANTNYTVHTDIGGHNQWIYDEVKDLALVPYEFTY